VLYVLHPTAPPWLASQRGEILPIYRTAALGFGQLHLHVAKALLDTGFRTSNVVAAFPSLHAAYPMLLLLFIWPRARWLTRVVALGYVLAMAFMLIATGEHWLIDVLAGWVLAVIVTAGPQFVRRVRKHHA
jgi:membrane-associated phospholipid phosphatase